MPASLTKLPDPTPPPPDGWPALSVAWGGASGAYLAVGSSRFAAGVQVLARSSNTLPTALEVPDADEAHGQSTDWTSDGSHLATCAGQPTVINADIVWWKRTGGTLTRLAAPAPFDAGDGASGAPPIAVRWNPAGDLLAILRITSSSLYLVVYERTGDSLAFADSVLIPWPVEDGVGFAWSPDGAYLAGMGVNDGKVWLVKNDDGVFTAQTTVQLGGGEFYDGGPVAWSPDGAVLSAATGAAQPGESGIWTLPLVGDEFGAPEFFDAEIVSGVLGVSSLAYRSDGVLAAVWATDPANDPATAPALRILHRYGTTLTLIASHDAVWGRAFDLRWTADGGFLASAHEEP